MHRSHHDTFRAGVLRFAVCTRRHDKRLENAEEDGAFNTYLGSEDGWSSTHKRGSNSQAKSEEGGDTEGPFGSGFAAECE